MTVENVIKRYKNLLVNNPKEAEKVMVHMKSSKKFQGHEILEEKKEPVKEIKKSGKKSKR